MTTFAKRHIVVAAICSVLLAPESGNAASVTQQSGKVLINKGAGFSPISSEAELRPGTQVMVQPGGLALITYANNCVVRIGAGIWMVQAVPPCANGATVVDFTGRMNQETQPADAPGMPPEVLGRSASHLETVGSATPKEAVQPVQDSASYVIGSFLAAGVVIELLWHHKKDTPVSP